MSPRTAAANELARSRSRAQLLDAALELFCERGYEATPVSAITARSGVSHGLVTYYFPAKSDLLDALLERWLAGGLDVIAALPSGAPDDELAAVIDTLLLGAARDVPLQRLMIGLMLQPSTRETYLQVERRLAGPLATADDRLRTIFTRRDARDADLEVIMLRSLVEGVLVKLAVYPDRFPLAAARTWLWSVYGLGAPAPLAGVIDPSGERRLRV